MACRYLLAFDSRTGTGVHEHFFHFMWGYLLPAAHAIIDIEADRSASGRPPNEYVFVSCGPVMDAKTVELARLLGVEASIVGSDAEGRTLGTTGVDVPRWDVFLREYAAYSRLRWSTVAFRVLRHVVRQRSIPSALWARRRIARAVRHLRSVVLQKVAAASHDVRGDDPERYYILQRSEEPAYYAPDHGGATRATYGTSRRSLRGIERGAAMLSRGSSRVDIFEPGRHTLEEQIRTLSRCKGIIAIRGAELANVVWLPSASRVVVINAGTFQHPVAPAWTLAKLLGIPYAEIEWGDDPYPALTDELIDRIGAHLGNEPSLGSQPDVQRAGLDASCAHP